MTPIVTLETTRARLAPRSTRSDCPRFRPISRVIRRTAQRTSTATNNGRVIRELLCVNKSTRTTRLSDRTVQIMRLTACDPIRGRTAAHRSLFES